MFNRNRMTVAATRHVPWALIHWNALVAKSEPLTDFLGVLRAQGMFPAGKEGKREGKERKG